MEVPDRSRRGRAARLPGARRLRGAGRVLVTAARAACHAGLAALFPADCLACGELLPWLQRGGVCLPCWDRLPWAPSSLRQDREPRMIVWAADYAGVFRDLIHALKFEGMDGLARPLGEHLAERVAPCLGHASSAAAPPPDLVTFVPLHWWRRARRGFNQAEEVARVVARHLRLPCLPLLDRHRSGRRQVGLRRRDRLTALAGCYRPRRPGGVARGKVVLLVDDVVTTGATLEACARALKGAGARAVYGCAVARTPGGRATRGAGDPGSGGLRD